MEQIGWILLEALIKAIVIVTLIMLSAAFSVYWERKLAAYIQHRYGPNRVGPYGVLQPFADVFKLFLKEDVVPEAADKKFHTLAPIITLTVTVSVFAVIPFAHYFKMGEQIIYFGVAPNLNIGILYVLALASVGVYGITFAGWGSNSKYSLLGGLRASAQMISYEISMGLAIVGVIMVVGSLSLNDIVINQGGVLFGFLPKWHIFLQPLGFLIFLITAFAETNRAPFDLPEAEPELVGGFNTEYSGMKFGMFFLAEYGNMATSAALITLLYLGGWQTPVPAETLGLELGSLGLVLAQFATFIIKVILIIFFFIWVRWSVPRFRYDQLMHLGWKVLLPLALLNVAITGVLVMLFPETF